MKQNKALDISQAQLPFELDVSVTPEGMGQSLWQRQQKWGVTLGCHFQSWKGTESQYTPIEQHFLAVHSNRPSGASQKVKKSSSQWAELRALWQMTTHEPWSLNLCTDSWAVLKRLTL